MLTEKSKKNTFILWVANEIGIYMYIVVPALSKCFVAVGSIEGVIGSKFQVPLRARGLLVKSSVE